MTARSVATVDDVLELYERHGDDPYGEDVTQTAHALQCASHAESTGAPPTLVAAALLHDVGHLAVDAGTDGWRDDDHHEAIGARMLSVLFGPAVAGPVALHVLAKRWRCAVDPGYTAALSSASRASLLAQGGPLDDAARARFESHPSFEDAIALRTWDDLAKDPAVATGSISDYEPLLRALARVRDS